MKRSLVADPADAAVRLAAAGDEWIATQLVVEGRAACVEAGSHQLSDEGGDARLLQPEAQLVLLNLVPRAAAGELPRREWGEHIRRELASNAAPAAAADDHCEPAVAGSLSELFALARRRVPADARAARVRAALALLPAPAALEQAAALLQLLRGACSADEPPLQRTVLERLGPLAHPPLGLAGLVQLPCLRRLERAAGSLPPSASTETARLLGLYPDEEEGAGLPPAAAPATTAAPSSFVVSDELGVFLEAAALARRGDQRGAKHGCVLVCEPEPEPRGGGEGNGEGGGGERGPRRGRVLGVGWNHEVVQRRAPGAGKKRVLHAECAAVADAVVRWGEAEAFAAFGRATAWIVELKDDVAYVRRALVPHKSGARSLPRVLTTAGTLRTRQVRRRAALPQVRRAPPRRRRAARRALDRDGIARAARAAAAPTRSARCRHGVPAALLRVRRGAGPVRAARRSAAEAARRGK